MVVVAGKNGGKMGGNPGKTNQPFRDHLAQANRQLESITLRENDNKLYIRGTKFPPRPGEEKSRREEISTGCNATIAGLKVALSKARQIDDDLLWNRFDWTPYLKGKKKPAQSVAEWVERYEQSWWEKTEHTPTKERSFQNCYRHYFRQLPPDAPLTLDLLRTTILDKDKSQPATRGRELYCMAYKRLAEFAANLGAIDLEELDVFRRELRELKDGYKPKKILPEDLPSEEQILEIWQAIDNPAWRWVYGMIATYGLRPSEIFRIDVLRFSQKTEALRVLDTTKTGARITYPCPATWRDRFELWNVQYPGIEIGNKSNEELGKKISQKFRLMNIPHIPYALRPAWCIRLALTGTVDSAIAAKWAGHSLQVHEKTYLQAISEAQFKQVFDRMKRQESAD